MKAGLVYPAPFGAGGIFGGGERYAIELARALAREIEVRLVTFGEAPRREREGHLEIEYVPPIRHWRDHPTNPWSVAFLSALRGVDVVHCMCWNTLASDLAVTWGHLTGKGVFVTDVGGGAGRTLQRFLPTPDWVDRYLVIAQATVPGFGRLRDRASVILGGVDTERYRPDPAATRRGVVFVGRLLAHKGVNYLIEGLPEGVPLTVIGRPYDADYFALLRDLARGKDVTFLTRASDDQIVHHLQRAEVAALPSVERTVYGAQFVLPELLGFAAMEAMACATPVICTRVGGLTELVEDGVSGFLVPPNDPGALRERIVALCTDADLARRLGGAARARIEAQFTWPDVARRCLRHYAAAVARTGRNIAMETSGS